MEPGCYDIPQAEYLADPCDDPSLSSGIIKTLLNASPAHAWREHPKLNPNYAATHKAEFDIGIAFHDLFLEGWDRAEVIAADSYRTNEAQLARQAAYAAGKVPLLTKHYDAVQAMAKAATAQLATHDEASRIFKDGQSEQTLIWDEDGVKARARLDWKPDRAALFGDLKSTGVSANPDVWISRQLFATGCDIQAAWYCRGIRATLGIDRPQFRFVVVETEPPYALSVIAVGEAVMDLANKKIDQALRIWSECLALDLWPAYPNQTAWADLPPWLATRWEESRIANESRETIEERYAL